MTSTVLLISDAASAVPVRNQRTGETAILAGTNKPEHLTLIYLPKTASVLKGDVLVTSGLGSVILRVILWGLLRVSIIPWKMHLFESMFGLSHVITVIAWFCWFGLTKQMRHVSKKSKHVSLKRRKSMTVSKLRLGVTAATMLFLSILPWVKGWVCLDRFGYYCFLFICNARYPNSVVCYLFCYLD